LFSVTTFLRYFAKSLLRNDVTQFDKDVFNTACQAVFKNFSEFVGLHYALSVRTDTEYWRTINKKVFNPGMIHLEPVTSTGFFDAQNKKMFTGFMDPSFGVSYISVGYNYPFFDSVDQRFNTFGADVKPYVNQNVERFNLQKKAWKKAAEIEPSLYEYLRDHIHND
jgi:hypothetical protein